MIEQFLQIGADFIEAQGMMAFVVVVLAVLMYRDQTNSAKKSEQQAEENKRQADNFAIESKQQAEILVILREEVANNAALIHRVDQLKNDLITEAQSISDAATAPIVASLDAYAQDVKKTGNEIMATLTPLEQSLLEIRNELRQLRESVDAHLVSSTNFRNDVTAKTTRIEERLLQVEKTATQETPVIIPSSEAKDATKAEPKMKVIPLNKESKS